MNRLFLLTVLFISACNSQSDNSTSINATIDSTTNSKEINEPSINGCYTSILKKDTSTLKINNDNGQIFGDLIYNRFEKDNNKGTIKGKIHDSLIIADYTFQSEGMTSVREVVFKISGTNLIEGYGDINMDGDTARFKNISQLKYQDDQPFVLGECK
jgi:hypothetical protein